MPPTRSMAWRARFGAAVKPAVVHFAVCLLVASLVAATVFGLWFPGDYRIFSGGTELFQLVVGVDLVLGPLITLAVFDPKKRAALMFGDLAVIAALQLGALGYGMHMVSISRPVVLALEEDRFRVVQASGVYEKELLSAPADLRSLSLTGPRLVRSRMPTDPDKKFEAVALGLSGYDIGTRPSLWTHWDAAARGEALAHAKPFATLARRYPTRQRDLDAAITATGRALRALVYIPMITFRGDWIALLDGTSGDVVGFAPFDGF